MTELTVSELAGKIGGQVKGDGSVRVSGIATLENAGPNDLSFLTKERYEEAAKATEAACVIVESADVIGNNACIIVPDAQLGYVKAMQLFAQERGEFDSSSEQPLIAESAVVDPRASVGPHTSIGARVTVGRDSKIGPNVTIGEDCKIGEDCDIHPGVVIYPKAELGNRVVIQANAVIGGPGFGYYIRQRPVLKIPQMGRVVIADDVEVGAGACIDRATLDTTYIGPRTKIDKLVYVGHNVRVEADVLIIGQSGIAGSATVKEGAELMGQVGIRGHTEVGPGARVLAKSFTFGDIEAGKTVGGIPAIQRSLWKAIIKSCMDLPDLFSRVEDLEKKLVEQLD